MITQIDVRNTATFGASAAPIKPLKKLNFFFGANGTGKTTISKVIADPSQYPSSSVSWKSDPLETRVYNREFVERNFQSNIKGVFTLGETEADTIAKIATAKGNIDKLNIEIGSLTNTLQGSDGKGGKRQELSQLESKYTERFWTAKQKYDKRFADVFKGLMRDKEKFKAKVLSESADNSAGLQPLDYLAAKVATVFSSTLTQTDNIAAIQTQALASLEHAPILKKRIIGKEDVDIAALITKLGNSDWVRQGKTYYDASDGMCPFCQQQTDESFAKNLNEYFDETFEQDLTTINTLADEYAAESERAQQQVQAILNSHSGFVDNDKLESEKKLLDSLVAINTQKLAQKKKETSQSIELESLQSVLAAIAATISDANAKIDENNTIICDLESEKTKLSAQVWKFVIKELKTDIADYTSDKSGLEAAITSIASQVQTKSGEMAKKKGELELLEGKSLGIKQTLGEINGILASFGFKSFSLRECSDEKSYELVRANGSDAHGTLSEGERNFVTFLYFYHLLKGSHDESGLNTDRIVVFDDPVSSLDSDVLFIVSSLIRELYEEVRKNSGLIKQIFVLTHNVYFHKEVTYVPNRAGGVRAEESFWLVKKSGVDSIVEPQTTNPIKTSYELLWDEVRSENPNNATIRNTLRRILESYFKLLGDIPLDSLYTKFDGNDKVMCKALCSWVHDGSHASVFSDEHYAAVDDAAAAQYLGIFKQVFEKCGHIAHYNMMMGIDPEVEQAAAEELS